MYAAEILIPEMMAKHKPIQVSTPSFCYKKRKVIWSMQGAKSGPGLVLSHPPSEYLSLPRLLLQQGPVDQYARDLHHRDVLLIMWASRRVQEQGGRSNEEYRRSHQQQMAVLERDARDQPLARILMGPSKRGAGLPHGTDQAADPQHNPYHYTRMGARCVVRKNANVLFFFLKKNKKKLGGLPSKLPRAQGHCHTAVSQFHLLAGQ